MHELLAIHSVPNMGSQRMRLILEHYAWDAVSAWADRRNWGGVSGLSRDIAALLISGAAKLDVDAIFEQFFRSGAKLLTLQDAAYPPLLREIHEAPPLLFYKGVLPKPDNLCLAMVGSRRFTNYGREVANLLSRDLARQGLWIVSGLARGIDSFCHSGALEAGGKTIAFVGSGIDICYPRENQKLEQKIIENGAVISELPVGSPPVAQNFPMRNRLISGISKGVVVVEAGEKSGTLRTVDFALSQGRDVFVVPGPITSPMSKGTNQLIKEGMCPITCAEDVLQHYPVQPALFPLETLDLREKTPHPLDRAEDGPTNVEKQILEMTIMPLHFDDMVKTLAMPPHELAARLTVLEVRGMIRQLPGNYYQKRSQRL